MVVSKGRGLYPKEARRSGKAVVLIQNGIHAGEIEGKDSGMLLLREILVTGEKKHLLDHLVLLIIPIFNVDGHELVSPYNRPNQNGPREMGWRTTSHNLNLNRDYMKADSPEMQSLLRLFSAWLPDFYIDNHTTDGMDYQYHITYDIETHQNIDQRLAGWGSDKLMPFVISEVEQQGFLTAPYIESDNSTVVNEPALPRLSTGYSALQNRLALLVETHSLKSFENRVMSTKAMNAATLEYINAHSDELRELNRRSDHEAIYHFAEQQLPFPLRVQITDHAVPFTFKGLQTHEEESSILGSSVTRYSVEPKEFETLLYNRAEVTETVIAPAAYSIPQEFASVARLLRLHGIRTPQLKQNETVIVQRYRFKDASFAVKSYEGRQQVDCGVEMFEEQVSLSKGTYIVPTRQRTLRVILHLLEPRGPDSLVRWGFFNAFFERKEYVEPYIMEPIATRMLEEDSALREEFERKLQEDTEFKDDPKARLDFFYRRSIYADKHENMYPIMRLPKIPEFLS